MEYYIKGSKENAKQIENAFEKLGYSTSLHTFFDEDTVFITLNGNVCECNYGGPINELIKTHPDYKELKLPVEPKFKVRDWVVCWDRTYQILDNKSSYLVREIDGLVTRYEHSTVDENGRLWTIKDAKDGDVLATGNIICIFKKLDKDGYYIISPCIYTVKDGLEVIDNEDDTIGSCGFKPATKEDRNLLFRKMKEAGYEWDEVKKELKKIQPHYDIANFHAGMSVLVRNSNDSKWYLSYYGFYDATMTVPFKFICINGESWKQCIPFNDDTKYLLGTTNMCPEEYINW